MEKQETFQAVQSLSLETSYGRVRSQKDVKLEITVGIHDGGETGFFELYDEETGGETWYASGCLWFNGNKLVEYDGVFSLPFVVEEKVKEWGYEIDL